MQGSCTILPAGVLTRTLAGTLAGCVLAVSGGWSAAATAQDVAPDAAPVSFRQELQPVLNARCVVCHVTGAENAGLNLQRAVARQQLVDVPSTQAPMARVAPGLPEASYLMHKLRGTHGTVGGSGAPMPFTDGNPSPLSPAELDLFERWIAQGAKDG